MRRRNWLSSWMRCGCMDAGCFTVPAHVDGFAFLFALVEGGIVHVVLPWNDAVLPCGANNQGSTSGCDSSCKYYLPNASEGYLVALHFAGHA